MMNLEHVAARYGLSGEQALALVVELLSLDIEDSLADRLSLLPPELGARLAAAFIRSAPEGPGLGRFGTVLYAISLLDLQQQDALASELARICPDCAPFLRDALVTFADLPSLPPRALELLLRDTEHLALAVALKGAPAEDVDKMLRHVSSRTRRVVLGDIVDWHAPLCYVDDRRRELVIRARRLLFEGRISRTG